MSETRSCQHCGAALAADARFCETCGQPVSEPLIPATPPVAVPSVAQARSNQPNWLVIGCVAMAAIIACVGIAAVGGYLITQSNTSLLATPTRMVVIPTSPTSSVSVPTLAANAEPTLPSSVSSTNAPTAIPSLLPTIAPTVAPLPTLPPAPVAPPGLYVTGVRLDPSPKRGVDIGFYPMFLNTTGATQTYRVRVYLFKPDNMRNSFGETSASLITIPVGATEQKALGAWKLGGGGGCEDFLVRVGWIDEGNRITFFNKPDNNIFDYAFAVCP